MADEVWFERWLWSYIPCHWKGWAILFTHVLLVLAAIGLLILTASQFERPWINDLDIIPFAIGLVSLMRICKRHSNPFGD